MQTRLVAFNASVEVKRAGEAGRSFSVVADAVKDLAEQVERSSKTIVTTVALLGGRIQELQRNILSNDEQSASFNQAFVHVEKSIGQIADSAQQNTDTCTATLEHMQELSRDVNKNSQAIEAAKKRTEQFLQASERLTELSAACGAQTEDTPFIQQVLSTPNKLAKHLKRL